MKDSKTWKPPVGGTSQDETHIVELTPEMEIDAGSKPNVIDLTEVLPSSTGPSENEAASKEQTATLAPDTPDVNGESDSSAEPTATKDPVSFEPQQNDTPLMMSDMAAPTAATDPPSSATQQENDDTPVPSDAAPPSKAADPASFEALQNDDTLILTDVVLPSELPPHEEAQTTVEPMATADQQIDGTADDDKATIELVEVVDPVDWTTDPQPVADIPGAHASTDDDHETTIEFAEVVDPADWTANRQPVADIPGAHASTDDDHEAIIELVEVVDPVDLPADRQPVADIPGAQASTDDDDEAIIELTDIVDLSERPADLADAAPILEDDVDEEVIFLTDIVHDEALSAPSSTPIPDVDDVFPRDERADEAVIEPVDQVDAPVPEIAAGDIEHLDTPQPEADDEAINLPELVDPEPYRQLDRIETEESVADDAVAMLDEALPAELEAAPMAATAPDNDEQVIRLDDVLLDQVRHDKDEIQADIGQDVEAAQDILPEDEPAGDTAPQITEASLEQMVQRIIRTQYAETIEKSIAKAVEEAVTREIASIKHNLMEDLGPEDE
ncbi:MAG: hypothetical protein KJP07_14180 [Desulfatitalea sp.]|nr:hypothetical protein [Desulfatitalea sp.]